jgi:MFS family permease
LAIAAVFGLNGATFASWLPRIPEVRDRLGVDNGTLGLVLLGAGLGGLGGSVLSGLVVHRLGSRRVTIAAGCSLCVVAPFVAVVPSPWLLLAVLVVAGCFDALTDIGMNAQAVQAQRCGPRSVMNRFHAGWSLGSVVGTLLGSAAAAAGLGVGTHLLVVEAALIGGLLTARRWLDLHDEPPERLPAAAGGDRSRRPARRSGAGLLIAGLALATAIAEATPMEWAAVFLTDELAAGAGAAGTGVVVYAAAMFGGRVVGDHAIDRFGSAAVLTGAVGLVAAGLVVAVAAGTATLAMAGFALWGLGVSVLFPMLYGAGGNLPGLPAAQGLALMTIGQRIGFLAGPPLVGRLGATISLPAAFLVAAGGAVLLLGVSLPRLIAATTSAFTRADRTPHS